jgi:hypothetical protein
VPLGDGSPLDRREALCRSVTPAGLPECMDMISATQVTELVENSIL